MDRLSNVYDYHFTQQTVQDRLITPVTNMCRIQLCRVDGEIRI